MATVLKAAILNAKNQGLTEEKLFVKEVVCGKGILLKKIDIKGRSKMGLIKKPKCSVRIVLEEKPAEEFYKMIISGKCPTGAAKQLKTILVQSEANLSTVHKMNPLLTSRGRYYRRTQFKRLVTLVLRAYKRRKQPVNRQKVERNLLEKAVYDYVEQQKQLQNQSIISNRSARQALFDKNYAKK